MYAGLSTPPLEIPTRGLFTSPYVLGQTNIYEFSIGDDDGGFIQNLGWNNNDYLGSYTLPSSLSGGINSITTSTNDADVISDPSELINTISFAWEPPTILTSVKPKKLLYGF